MATAGSSAEKPKVVFVIGSTGVGKTKLGVDIAKQFQGEVINADAMQVHHRRYSDVVGAVDTNSAFHHVADVPWACCCDRESHCRGGTGCATPLDGLPRAH